jgi:LEA14-like dessication related protein
MSKRRAQFFVMFALLLMTINLTGCKTLGQVLNNMFQKPKIKYKRMHLRDVSLKGMAMDFDFTLINPNAVEVNLTHFSYTLRIDGNEFAKGTTKRAMLLKAQGEGPLRVPFGVEFQKLMKSLLAFFQAKKDHVAYHLTFQVGFQTPIGEVILPPLDIRGRAPIPRLPKLRMIGVTLGEISLLGATLNFKVGVKNEGKFPLRLRGMNYGIRVSGVNVGGGQTALSALKPGGEQVLNIPLQMQFMKVGMAIANVIRSKQLPYDFGGKIDLGLFKLPFQVKGKQQL